MLRSHIWFFLALGVFCLSAAGQSRAGSTSYWRTDSYRDLSAGEPTGVSVLRDGSLAPGPAARRREVEGAQYVWSAVRAPDGAVYAVCGTPGRLVRVRNGEIETLVEDETSDYTALALSPEGDVFVGSAPGGIVYRLASDSGLESVLDTGQGYVWSMAYSREHGLVVGTGDSACVYLMDDGDAELIYHSSEASVTSIASVDGRIVIGTAPGGLLLDVTPGSEHRVLYDSHYEEVTGIARGPAGAVVFAATTVSFDDVLSPGEEFGQNYGDGSVYALTPAGGAVELWYSGDAPITALGSGVGGDVWVGTGNRGRVYAVDHKGSAGVVTELDDDQVLSVAGGPDGAVVTTGMGAAIYEVGASPAAVGSYESDVLDAGAAAFWGEISWDADEHGDARVRILTRSGNMGTPDRSWSAWERVEGAGEGRVTSPSARFLQWRAELATSGGRSPILRSVEAAYTIENLPPRVGPVVVYEPDEVVSNGTDGGPTSQTLPSGVELTYSLSGRGRDSTVVPVLLRGVRTVEWDADDPNGDLLDFHLWIRSDDELEWKLLAGPIERQVHTWDSVSMPDGRYRMKVVATDRPSNSPDLSAEGEAESDPFVVDNSPPAFAGLEVRRAGGAVDVSGRVADSWTPIARVEISLDYGDWKRAHSRDGSYDSTEESFEASLEVEPGPELAVAVRAVDRAGNVSVERTVVR